MVLYCKVEVVCNINNMMKTAQSKNKPLKMYDRDMVEKLEKKAAK